MDSRVADVAPENRIYTAPGFTDTQNAELARRIRRYERVLPSAHSNARYDLALEEVKKEIARGKF